MSNDLLKSIAKLAANDIAANRGLCDSNVDDPQYGLVPSKPIYTAFIEGEKEYLSSLRTLDGETLTWERKGSMAVMGINGMVDIYETYLPSGDLYKTLYLNMYCDKTSRTPPTGFLIPNSSSQKPILKEKPVATTNSKTRFCKFCGGAIDPNSKKCTSCGKQFFRLPKPSANKFVVILVILAVIFGIGGYLGFNYFNGVEAMNNQQFIVAQQYFDNMLVGEKLFPSKYAYIEAGVLKETGQSMQALYEFSELKGIPVPASLINELKEEIYNIGIENYRNDDIYAAKANFSVIEGYKRSDDYMLLIQSKISVLAAESNYDKLVELIGFENAIEVLLNSKECTKKFLCGRWETNTKNPFYYFEIDYKGNANYNLPHESLEGYHFLNSNKYVVFGESNPPTVVIFEFTIVDNDTISVYCYKDGSTYTLHCTKRFEPEWKLIYEQKQTEKSS